METKFTSCTWAHKNKYSENETIEELMIYVRYASNDKEAIDNANIILKHYFDKNKYHLSFLDRLKLIFYIN
jgi:hypothetical protein